MAGKTVQIGKISNITPNKLMNSESLPFYRRKLSKILPLCSFSRDRSVRRVGQFAQMEIPYQLESLAKLTEFCKWLNYL